MVDTEIGNVLNFLDVPPTTDRGDVTSYSEHSTWIVVNWASTVGK
jgi:hypothetical protein